MAGKRDSEWMVVRRCLDMVLCIMRGDATKQDLLEIIMRYADANDEALDRKVAEKRFENDRLRMREKLNWDIGFRRADGVAYFKQNERPFIDLSPEAIRGLAFLRQSFAESSTPFTREVTALTNTITHFLSDTRRHELDNQRALLRLDLQPRDGDHIAEAVFETIRIACAEHRLLEFDYYSSKRGDNTSRRHVVEPYDYYFDNDHYYLDAECRSVQTARGLYKPPQPMPPYRIGRMNNLVVLPTKFYPHRRSIPTVEIKYWLAPDIARRGVTQRFEGSLIEPQSDGSAVITFQSQNLFMDLRELLHYGGNCRVLGSEQALTEIKKIVATMWQHYNG